MANNNPFADAFKSWTDVSNPSFDYKDALAAGRKNVEASIAAGQVVAEGLQSIARKQAEVARNAAQEAIDFWKDLSASKSVEASASKQAEFAKSAAEQSLNSSREIFDIASKVASETYEILSKQAQQAANDFSKPAASSGSNKKQASGN